MQLQGWEKLYLLLQLRLGLITREKKHTGWLVMLNDEDTKSLSPRAADKVVDWAPKWEADAERPVHVQHSVVIGREATRLVGARDGHTGESLADRLPNSVKAWPPAGTLLPLEPRGIRA
eukprot:scaffold128533_cov37-Tisochrysis_lutea.AAC.1